MTAQWYADAERNLRKTVGLALKPIKASYQLDLLLTKAFALALILVLASAGPAAAQQAEKPAPSVGQLEAAVKRRPSDPKLHVALGLAYWERNDYPRALVGVPARRQGRTEVGGGAQLAGCRPLGEVRPSRRDCRRSERLSPSTRNTGGPTRIWDPCWPRAVTLPEAVAVFQKALALEPNSLAAHLNLGMALRDKGDLDAALEHLRPRGCRRPDNASIQYELGQTLRQTRRSDGCGRGVRARRSRSSRSCAKAYYALGMALKQQSAAARKPRAPAASPADDLYKRAHRRRGAR